VCLFIPTRRTPLNENKEKRQKNRAEKPGKKAKKESIFIRLTVAVVQGFCKKNTTPHLE
jgi:hypothetical protein